jgi:hypothetical protein
MPLTFRRHIPRVQLLPRGTQPATPRPRLIQPDLRPVWGAWFPCYELAEPYAARWSGPDGKPREVVVPPGRTDGSTEWMLGVFLWWVPVGVFALLGVRADGLQRAAALVHDYLYSERQGTRAEADWAFYDLCKQGGMAGWTAWTRWAVLRAVGWAWWWT